MKYYRTWQEQKFSQNVTFDRGFGMFNWTRNQQTYNIRNTFWKVQVEPDAIWDCTSLRNFSEEVSAGFGGTWRHSEYTRRHRYLGWRRNFARCNCEPWSAALQTTREMWRARHRTEWERQEVHPQDADFAIHGTHLHYRRIENWWGQGQGNHINAAAWWTAGCSTIPWNGKFRFKVCTKYVQAECTSKITYRARQRVGMGSGAWEIFSRCQGGNCSILNTEVFQPKWAHYCAMWCIIARAGSRHYAKWTAGGFCKQITVVSRNQLLPDWEGTFGCCICYAPIRPVCLWTTRLNRIRPPTTADFNEETIERRSSKIAAHAARTAAIWFYSHLQKRRASFHCRHPLKSISSWTLARVRCRWASVPVFIKKRMGENLFDKRNNRIVRRTHRPNTRADSWGPNLKGAANRDKNGLAFWHFNSKARVKTLFPHPRRISNWGRHHLQRQSMPYSCGSCHEKGHSDQASFGAYGCHRNIASSEGVCLLAMHECGYQELHRTVPNLQREQDDLSAERNTATSFKANTSLGKSWYWHVCTGQEEFSDNCWRLVKLLWAWSNYWRHNVQESGAMPATTFCHPWNSWHSHLRQRTTICVGGI